MSRFIVTIGLITIDNADIEMIKELIPEQWEQTGAATQGDTIEVIGVEKVDL